MKSMFGALVITICVSVSILAGEIPSDGFGGNPPGNTRTNGATEDHMVGTSRFLGYQHGLGFEVAIIELVSGMFTCPKV